MIEKIVFRAVRLSGPAKRPYVAGGQKSDQNIPSKNSMVLLSSVSVTMAFLKEGV